MKMRKIKDGVNRLGVVDWNRRLFDSLETKTIDPDVCRSTTSFSIISYERSKKGVSPKHVKGGFTRSDINLRTTDNSRVPGS